MTDLHFDLYTKPDCIQCAMTRRHLDRLGVPYRELDAMSNLDTLTDHGIQAAPGVLAYADDILTRERVRIASPQLGRALDRLSIEHDHATTRKDHTK